MTLSGCILGFRCRDQHRTETLVTFESLSHFLMQACWMTYFWWQQGKLQDNQVKLLVRVWLNHTGLIGSLTADVERTGDPCAYIPVIYGLI